jgi:hypothetical protein
MFGTVFAAGLALGGSDLASASEWDPAFVAALAPRATADADRWRFELGGFYEHIELGTIRQDDIRAQFGQHNSTKVGETNHEDVDRWRTGVQIGFGTEAFRVEGRVFYEAFEIADHFTDYGASIGIEGQPRLARGQTTSLILDYGAEITYSRGDGDVPFLDRSSGQVFDVEGDLSYWESIFRLGLGIDIGGFQLTAGGLYEGMSGLINLDLDDDMEFESFGWAGYARAAWRPEELPFYVAARGYLGDYSGFMAEIGFRL